MESQSPVRLLSRHKLGSIIAEYYRDAETGQVGLQLLPASKKETPARRRLHLSGVSIDSYAQSVNTRIRAFKADSLIQVKELSDPYAPGFSQGRTLRNSATVTALKWKGQTIRRSRGETRIRSIFEHESKGWRAVHDLLFHARASWVESLVTIENTTAEAISLELLASFSIGGVSPYARDFAPGRIKLHRIRSVWSMEGRLETRLLEDLQLEPSFTAWGVRNERFGAVGSMPVNGFFPFAAVEDTRAGVVWAAQLAHLGSWQMEVYRRDDTVSISGGLADRELGHWVKRLAPGETFASPRALLTCVEGSLGDACQALTAAQRPAALAASPRAEKGLPVIFNEWATTWGHPSHAKMAAMAARLRGTGVKYLVMDAGWFKSPHSGEQAIGDWAPNPELFPGGLRAMSDAVRAEGLIPGIWFELETAVAKSEIAARHPEWLLHRDGRVLTVGDRHFLDLRKKAVVNHLKKHVIELLRRGNFGYLKIDYNDNIGFGVDGPQSPGENLREHLAAVQDFVRLIRSELPGLVIENCSSGGHRLEPSMLALTAMSSFSDAHECPEIPIIAANLHRVMLPRQSQIWVVLRKGEALKRTYYSFAAGFLGRMCISGDLVELSPEQMQILRRAVRLYRGAAPIIDRGTSFRHGPDVETYGSATGWQGVVRASADGRRALVVAHTFGGGVPEKIELPLPAGTWVQEESFALNPPELARKTWRWSPGGAWNGCMALLRKKA